MRRPADHEIGSDAGIAATGGDQAEHLDLAVGQAREAPRPAHRVGQHAGVDDRRARGDLLELAQERRWVEHAVLEEVAEAGRAPAGRA